MKTAKSHQDTIRKIDILSGVVVSIHRERSKSDYDRGALCGYQLSISLLASEIPNFASNAFERPREMRRAA